MLRKLLLTVAAALMVVGFGISSGQAAPLAPAAAKTEIGSNVVQVQHRHYHRRHHHVRRPHVRHYHRHVRPRVVVVPRVHHHRHHHHRPYKRW